MQQVNLYQPLFRKQEKIFSAKTMMQGGAIIALGMVVFAMYAAWQTRNLMNQVEQIQLQRDAAAKRMEESARNFPERSKDLALEQEVNRLRGLLRTKQQVVARLTDTHEGNTSGYATHLEGLARQRLPQVWLTHVGLSRGGAQIELKGSALQPEQVPQYLQRLSQEAAFSGAEFRHFIMSRPEKTPQQVDFVLMTEKADKK